MADSGPVGEDGGPSCTGCTIAGACVPAGIPNPANPCEVCDPTASATSFSPNDGAACDDGSFCTTDDACSGATCTGTARDCGDGIACNGEETCDETADACEAGSPTCAAGTLCDASTDTCVTTCSGCVVDGSCYGEGQVDPTNACRVCDVARATDAWSDADGARCDDGFFCTVGDVCAAGTCAGTSRDCEDGVDCNGAETCDETGGACAAGISTCTTAEVCDTTIDACVTGCAGCVVGGVCFADGTRNPSAQCEVCDVSVSTTAFSPADGASCDDGLFCTSGDVCAGTVCAGSAGDFCGDGIACNGAETCNETTDRCQAGAATCPAGQVCDAAADSCVTACSGCVIGGVCYAPGTTDPADGCRVCAPASSTTSFSPNTGASCDDGQFCTVGDACSSAGTCAGGTARACSDGVACNGAETCNEGLGRCVAGTTTCTGGLMCDTAIDMCVLVCAGGTTQCGASCVDTRYDPANCGGCGTSCPSLPSSSPVCVSSACSFVCSPGFADCTSGAGCETNTNTDTANCGGCGRVCAAATICASGTCVAAQSCRHILAAAPGSPSGTYTLDPDGAGGAAPFTAYCDMTTAGGGWTLTYKVRNDISSSSNPWWNQVTAGSGTTFPTALTRPTAFFEGPTAATRGSFWIAAGATEFRAQMIRDATAAVLYDVRSSYMGDPARGLRCFATGTCASEPTQSCSTSGTAATVISTAISGSVPAGGSGYLCDIGWTDCSFCVDWIHVSSTPSQTSDPAIAAQFVGDSSIGRTDTTTYFWIR